PGTNMQYQWLQRYLLIVAAIGFIHAPRVVYSQIIVTPNIEELCKSAPVVTHRKTLLYVDLTTIAQGKTDWGLAVLNRLELGPREPLTILGVDPSTFEFKEVFNSCYPTLLKSEIEQIRSTRGAWDKLIKLDPEDQQRENIQTFDTRLRNALDRLISSAILLDQSKRKNILGALAFDKNRFGDPKTFYRVIIH